MHLYLLRHAEALPVGGSVRRDHDRPLSRKGERDAHLMGTIIAKLESSVGRILSSPLLRARQTADQILEGLSNHPAVTESVALAPGFQPEDLLEEVLASGVEGSVVAIGHQPDIGQCISSLIAGGSPASIEVVPCAMAKLVIRGPVTRPQVRLSWFLTPELARHIVPKT